MAESDYLSRNSSPASARAPPSTQLLAFTGSGAGAGALSAFVFSVIHHFLISPIWFALTLASAILLSVRYRATWLGSGAIVITAFVIVFFLGLNFSILGLVAVPRSLLYVLVEVLGLILALAVVYAGSVVIIWRRMSPDRGPSPNECSPDQGDGDRTPKPDGGPQSRNAPSSSPGISANADAPVMTEQASSR